MSLLVCNTIAIIEIFVIYIGLPLGEWNKVAHKLIPWQSMSSDFDMRLWVVLI